MPKLDELNKDPELETAITVMTELVASGFYTEMGENVPEKTDPTTGKTIEHPNKTKIDEWSAAINADEKISLAVREMFEKGFSATEIIPDQNNDLKVLPSETVFIWRNKLGKTLKYTQEVGGHEVARWEGKDIENIIWLAHKETPANPYGKPMAYSIEDYLTARLQMTQDAPAVLHKIGYPLRRWESPSKDIMDKVYDQATNRNPDEDLFIDGVQEGDLKVATEETNARINFEGFLAANDQRIAEGLFSPLMSYLRNATEASATKMLEAIDRHVQGIQLYVERRYEKYAFAKICGEPVPRLVWGSPQTGVEEISLADVGTLFSQNAITFEQTQDLLKKLGLPLQDIPAGTQAQPLPSIQDLPLLDNPRMTTMQASLNVIEQNWKEKNIDIATAFREANRVIEVHIGAARQDALKKIGQTMGQPLLQLSPESENCFTLIRAELASTFRQRLLPHGAHQDGVGGAGNKRYTVIAH
jgi:hypothetical protein